MAVNFPQADFTGPIAQRTAAFSKWPTTRPKPSCDRRYRYLCAHPHGALDAPTASPRAHGTQGEDWLFSLVPVVAAARALWVIVSAKRGVEPDPAGPSDPHLAGLRPGGTHFCAVTRRSTSSKKFCSKVT